MVTQYPHMLWVTVNTNATKDGNGDWIPGSPGTLLKLKCRAESSSGNGYLTGSDGKRIDYSWVVYLPLDQATLIPTGSPVSIYDGDTLILEKDTVKRFSKGQLNIRVWL